MTEDISANLALLRSAFGEGPLYVADGEAVFEVDGIEFICDYQPSSTADRFYLLKNPDAVPGFLDRIREFAGGVIVELGIAEGGSVALLAIAAKPRKLVALELEQRSVEPLGELISSRGLSDAVHLHFGVDQADRSSIARLLRADIGDEPIDLVIDDASHKLAPTRSSFETIFPRLRPGGLYVIEDWSAEHRFRHAVARELRIADDSTKARLRQAMATRSRETERKPDRPLSDLVVELLLLRAQDEDIVREISVGRFDVAVRRGGAELDRESFRLEDCLVDYYGYLDR